MTATADASGVTAEAIAEALRGFAGEIEQVPPRYSALKRGGKRMYDLARSGIEVTPEPRPVLVEEIALESYEPPLASVFVRCGRGFYMRSLAHDLGAALGVGGNLKALVRLRSGPFRIQDSLSLEATEAALGEGRLGEILHAPDAAVSHLPAAVLGASVAGIVRQGQPIPSGARILPTRPGERARAYGPNGEFIAVLIFDGASAQWRPQRVFSISYLEDSGDLVPMRGQRPLGAVAQGAYDAHLTLSNLPAWGGAPSGLSFASIDSGGVMSDQASISIRVSLNQGRSRSGSHGAGKQCT